MKKLLLIIIISTFFFSCKTSKSSIITSKEEAKEKGIYSYNDGKKNSIENVKSNSTELHKTAEVVKKTKPKKEKKTRKFDEKETKTVSISKDKKIDNSPNNSDVSSKKKNIVEDAKTNLGVNYLSGGTTKDGMDCSGLVFSTFQKNDVSLPRISKEMANEGRKISESKAQTGDLIFFKTNSSDAINHVGIITENIDGEIKFIHSSTSKGVIISSLRESYYARAFEQINRVVD